MPDWVINRIIAYGTAVGMEAFAEGEVPGHRNLVLGGKVLVVDVEFAVAPTVDVIGVRTSYAVPNGSASVGGNNGNSAGSVSIDAHLLNTFRLFVQEALKGEDADALEAGRLGKSVQDGLGYLMRLDRLAVAEGDGGLRWFSDLEDLGKMLEGFAKEEATAVASALGTQITPLDIHLLRAHALPLPYLLPGSPSLAFLTYLSPLAYLTLLRSAPSVSNSFSSSLPSFDIPIMHVRSILSSHAGLPGTSLALLTLLELPADAVSLRSPPSAELSSLSTRPTFPLFPVPPEFDQSFPLPLLPSPDSQYAWILDFTNAGRTPGMVMTQGRMQEIENVVNPLSGIAGNDVHAGIGGVPGGRDWVDLLLNGLTGGNVSLPYTQYYTASYTSPSNMHPPLRLRLTAPDEPGFVLERVQVYTLREVWAILEIVKEQSWLNEMIRACEWKPEASSIVPESSGDEGKAADEEELQALLNGTFTPTRLPINIYLPSAPIPHPTLPTSPLFPPTSVSPPRIVLTLPERPPISGLVEIFVSYDPTKARGVSVDVRGAVPVELPLEGLEEVVRRGGIWGVPGRVWQRAGV
ncbi:hypothetical protein EWM64_g9528 [Hericium alpestre]|uniref:Mediator complex subunit 1 n=1 Tax=Hericium alpestre TaxID=135208 RepID=A0A4Y9ZJ52_9AGAM|nr:hypothetical protein EWM64_g9528 [Hericium alpestre]